MPWVRPENLLGEAEDGAVEVIVIDREEIEPWVQKMFEYINRRTGREGPRRFRPSRKGAEGMRARYLESRRQGMTHEEAIQRLERAVEWSMRVHWPKPDGQQWVNPVTIFRPNNWALRI